MSSENTNSSSLSSWVNTSLCTRRQYWRDLSPSPSEAANSGGTSRYGITSTAVVLIMHCASPFQLVIMLISPSIGRDSPSASILQREDVVACFVPERTSCASSSAASWVAQKCHAEYCFEVDSGASPSECK